MELNAAGGYNQRLRSLFERCGYRRYKMSKFEEYDLYASNRSFLPSTKVLTFTDTDGKLLALKPDVTLSIIRSFRGDGLEKLYYHENVYRESEVGFREIEQAGLECIGAVDEYCVCEVLSLAAKSLGELNRPAELDVSHLGILRELLKNSGIDEPSIKTAVLLFGEKNSDGLQEFLKRSGASEDCAEAAVKLSKLDCTASDAPEALGEILSGLVSWERLQLFCDTCEFLGREFPNTVRVDFSTVGDLDYYSGIIFRGYVEGVPQSVLSGGQYDELAARLRKNARAIGFAVYLDLLKPLFIEAQEYDSDALLIYSDDLDPDEIHRCAEELRSSGKSVLVMKNEPENLKFKEVYLAKKGGAKRVG